MVLALMVAVDTTLLPGLAAAVVVPLAVALMAVALVVEGDRQKHLPFQEPK